VYIAGFSSQEEYTMSEHIIFYTAVWVFSLLSVGLLLTMWEFSRLNRRQQPQVREAARKNRLSTVTTFGYATGYSGA
jgi:hypothetical protein